MGGAAVAPARQIAYLPRTVFLPSRHVRLRFPRALLFFVMVVGATSACGMNVQNYDIGVVTFTPAAVPVIFAQQGPLDPGPGDFADLDDGETGDELPAAPTGDDDDDGGAFCADDALDAYFAERAGGCDAALTTACSGDGSYCCVFADACIPTGCGYAACDLAEETGETGETGDAADVCSGAADAEPCPGTVCRDDGDCPSGFRCDATGGGLRFCIAPAE